MMEQREMLTHLLLPSLAASFLWRSIEGPVASIMLGTCKGIGLKAMSCVKFTC